MSQGLPGCESKRQKNQSFSICLWRFLIYKHKFSWAMSKFNKHSLLLCTRTCNIFALFGFVTEAIFLTALQCGVHAAKVNSGFHLFPSILKSVELDFILVTKRRPTKTEKKGERRRELLEGVNGINFTPGFKMGPRFFHCCCYLPFPVLPVSVILG